MPMSVFKIKKCYLSHKTFTKNVINKNTIEPFFKCEEKPNQPITQINICNDRKIRKEFEK